MSLATAIDLLMACNWNFVRNLEIVLSAIGGNLEPSSQLALCARNVRLAPVCDRMVEVAKTLQGFSTGSESDEGADEEILISLGPPTDAKKWLAASLDKTIRLQLGMH